jgi:hypothetical protein
MTKQKKKCVPNGASELKKTANEPNLGRQKALPGKIVTNP